MTRPTPGALARTLLCAAVLAGCATTATYTAPESRDLPALPGGEIGHEVFLVGNTADGDPAAVLGAVRAEMERAGEEATWVFLGDQTSAGLPEAGTRGRAAAEAELDRVIAAARDLEGEVVVIPGDRDWAEGEDGLKRIEDYLEAELGDVLTPGDQSGGPREEGLADGLRLIALDTAWWLLDERPEGEAEDLRIAAPSDVVQVLDGIIADRDDDRILVVGHHPIESKGRYAGARTVGEGAMTLGLGPLVQNAFGLDPRDLAYPRTRAMRLALDASLSAHNELVYAASHDRALQAFRVKRNEVLEQTYLVSGSAGAADPTGGGGDAYSIVSRPGYQRVVFFADGSLWVESVVVDGGGPEVVFRHQVSGVIQELLDPGLPGSVGGIPELAGETVTMPADGDFANGGFVNTPLRRAVFGEGYRDDWKTPVEFEVLDLGTVAGGLTPVKRGGGMQTTGLRLQGADGFQYGLRLLEKGGTRQLPGELRDGFVGDVVLDLRSAMTPYGALVAAPLEEAAGILTARPRIVYVPDDPRLGRYRETFKDRLALFELRLDDDVSALFPTHDDLVSSQKMREEMMEDQDHRVDQRAFARARLFDMLLGDWDRHQDQWRWSAREPGVVDPTLTGDAATAGKVYTPVPRDRDFSFYEIGGALQRALFVTDKRLQPFSDDYGSIQGLTQNGFFQDRRFLNALTRDDLVAAARDLQTLLTDAAIDRAVAQLPDPIEALRGDDYRRTLRVRRDKLTEAASDLYDLHARTVDVLGSNQRELAEITHAQDHTLVELFKYSGGEKQRRLYSRRFMVGETNEVRVYLFAGRDRVVVRGDGGVRVRVIGGGGRDALDAQGRLRYYDTADGAEIESARGAELVLRDEPGINRYDPMEYVPPKTMTIPFVGANPTDGVILGAARTWLVPGFRLHPYAATHTLRASVATEGLGVAVGYDGLMRDALFSRDLRVNAVASTPRYVRNFYGIGNEGPFVTNDEARLDLARATLDVGLGGGLGTGFSLFAGPSVRYADARRDTTLRIFSDGRDALGLLEADYSPTAHAGAFAEMRYVTNDAVNPRQGFALGLRGSAFGPLSGDGADAYGTLGGDVRVYVPIRYGPQVTLALRAGADHRFGDFPFFAAATLGGSENLRGFRRERFSGETAAFGNAELRLKAFDLTTFLLPVEVGVLGFADAGRVWGEDPVECRGNGGAGGVCVGVGFPDPDIRTGVGGGLWVNGLDRAVFRVTAATSEEESLLFRLAAGFQF